MDKNNQYNNEQTQGKPEDAATQNITPDEVEAVDNFDAIADNDEAAEEVTAEINPEVEIENLKNELAKEKREYLFLMAEFDNFRKRTLKEKSEIIKNAGENVFKGLLPIVDDFERGLKAAQNGENAEGMLQGMELVYKKLKSYLSANGVKEFDPEDKTFDADRHEAISVVPVPDEAQKGKILDTIEKGYTINDKVLRHAKVVVGQ